MTISSAPCRSLTVELADLKATLAEVRLAFATDRTQARTCRHCRSDLAHCSDAVPVAEEDPMMTRERIKVAIQIAARVAELRRLAERTARDYEADADTLPAEHRRLRRLLFAIAAARRGRKGAR
jgi:hypothetical protein